MRQIFDLRKMALVLSGLLIILLLGGCAAGISTPRAKMELLLGSPAISEREKLPVIYPYRPYRYREPLPAGRRLAVDPMAEAFGPVWHGLQAEYPEYRFN